MCAKRNNKGFSLMELVVAMAIMMIVGGCIYAFISACTRSYSSVSKDVDLQEEAQLAMNQLSSILMNAQNGVTYVEGAGTDAGNKKLYIYNSDNRYVIEKKKDDNSLYYSIESRKKDETSGDYLNDFNTSAEGPALMAEYLTDIDVVVDDSSSTTVVNVTMNFEKSEKNYTTSQKVALRNSVRINSDVDAIYAEDLGNVAVSPTYTGITVQLGTNKFSSAGTNAQDVVLTDSGDIVLPLSVAIIGDYYPSQSYQAVLTGSSVADASSQSRVEGSNVIIAKGETAANLTLTVLASSWPTLQCIVGINVKRITGIAIGNNITNPDTAFRLGSEITLGSSATNQLYATVTGTGNLSEEDKKFTWIAGENCSISGNLLVITSDESKVGQTFTVTAKSSTTDKTDTFSGVITARSTNLLLTSDSARADRGGSVQFTATDGSEEYPQKDVTYSYTVSGNVSADMFTLSKSGKLSVSKDLDYTKEYTVTVTAALSYKTDISQSVTITVPAVSLEYALSENGTYSNKVTVPMKNLTTEEGKNTYTVYYRVTGIKDGKLSKVNWTQWSNSQDTFAKTTSIGSNTITFTKVDQTYDGAVYVYNSTYYELYGTPEVGGVQLSASPISVINNYGNISIDIKKNNGNYTTYSYYIPVEATDGYVTLAGTDVQYRVTYKSYYWLLELKESGSTKYRSTRYTSYGWGWNES